MPNTPKQTSYSRRTFLQKTGTAAIAAGSLAPALIGQAKARKMNLLFLWTDEQRPDTMAVYGNRKIQTPNLNRLSEECVVFKNAYVSQPVCTPSRSTVMTGLWPHANGCYTNNIHLQTQTPCVPELIQDADYRTAYMGKWHLGDEIFAQHGYQEWIAIEDGYRKYYSEGRDRDLKSDYHHFLLQHGYEPDTSSGHFSRGFAARRPIEHCKPKFLELNACDFLRRHKDDPFILHINFLEPHMPFYGPLDDLHSMAEIDLPPNYNDPLEDDEPLAYRLKRLHYLEKGFEGNDLKTEAGWRRLITNYWGLCSQVDRSVGEILKTLEKLGLAENTIVVYTSDHGDMMGAHQLLAKTVMYEESVRIPWLMRIPQQGMKQQIVNGSVSHIDMVPTLLDLMGKPGKSADHALPGKSLKAQIEKGAEPKHDVFIEWNPGTPNPSVDLAAKDERDEAAKAMTSFTRTVVTNDRWKLCLNTSDKHQLFNLNDDPFETTNLFYRGDNKKRITDMTKRIHKWQKSVNDKIEV